jgi:hypothetical protein
MAIQKDDAEKTIRARLRRVQRERLDAEGETLEMLDDYYAELKSRLGELNVLDGSETASDEDKAKAHLLGMWCRENQPRHVATCPSSVALPPTEGPGPPQVIALNAIVAPTAVGKAGT